MSEGRNPPSDKYNEEKALAFFAKQFEKSDPHYQENVDRAYDTFVLKRENDPNTTPEDVVNEIKEHRKKNN